MDTLWSSWPSFGIPSGLFWSPFGTLGSLCGPFGPLMVSFWNPCTPCGLLVDSFRSVLGCFGSSWDLSWCILGLNCVFYVHCRYWQDFFAICLRVEFILSLPANWRFPSLAVQVTESASGRFRSLGEAPVGGVLGGNWSGCRCEEPFWLSFMVFCSEKPQCF